MLLGQSNLDSKGLVNYKNFALKAKIMIEELFNLGKMTKIARMISQGIISEDKIEHSTLTNMDLFTMFKKYDKNLNGVLEIDEYIECMKDQDTDLT